MVDDAGSSCNGSESVMLVKFPKLSITMMFTTDAQKKVTMSASMTFVPNDIFDGDSTTGIQNVYLFNNIFVVLISMKNLYIHIEMMQSKHS